MKIALVHDYLAQDGGAERVLKTFHEIWPQAPIFVLFHNKKMIDSLPEAKINQSFISRLPFGKKFFQWYLPLMPVATEKHNLHEFDVVLSSTSSFAKGVLTRPETLHISYCHTPPRYLWTEAHEYLTDLRLNRAVKALLPRIIYKLRMWDQMSADRVDFFIANSRTVQLRINKYYRRASDLIYPPVDLEKFRVAPAISDYFAAGGRLVPYKKIDLVVKTFNRLKWPLKIFGVGPELNALQKMAKPNIEFLGKISDEEKASLLGQARAFIHPQLEDCGITPLETMASGRPVIAYAAGGATETVLPNETGVFFHKQNWESLYKILLNFDPYSWDGERVRQHAAKFNSANFKQKIKDYVEHRYEEFKKGLSQERLFV
ncbi:glycosyltransferase family 4 protein [Patescibacteria group bacterium]|nr:MAG: glycosyltransferase family 4 protein [Patescibacteria group bacterium]